MIYQISRKILKRLELERSNLYNNGKSVNWIFLIEIINKTAKNAMKKLRDKIRKDKIFIRGILIRKYTPIIQRVWNRDIWNLLINPT